MDNWNKPFFKGVLRESDGTPSMARTGTLIALLSAVLWVSYTVKIHREIPNLTEPMNWVGGISLAMYGLNQAGSTVRSFAKKTDEVSKSQES